MTESMLKSLMKLFALLASINLDATHIFSRNFVESYLKGQFSPRLVDRSISAFDQYLEDLASLRSHSSKKRITSLSVKILIICNEINSELHLRSKFLIIFSIIQFAKHFEAHSSSREEFKETVLDAVNTISEALMINESEFKNCTSFITDKFFKVPERSSLLVVNNMDSLQFKDIKHLKKAALQGQFFFLKIKQADLYIFYYSGHEVLELGGKNIFPNHIYVFPKGSSIKSEHFSPLYYGDIVSAFRRGTNYPKISLYAEKIDFRYPNSDIGVHELSLDFYAGEMIGVMGGSGTGKSTLMGVLNGTIKADSGAIYINGKRFESVEQSHRGVIGFVPQDDLLIEELTVFDNLYYNAKLCLGNLSEKDIIKRIARVLNNLDLFYIKDLKVGSPLNKFISGGQRKRLNIALELIREPYILFVDEPTSGLSSTDSENVLFLLKEQALSGKILVINIHQPSSDLFKLFDKAILLDKGGYPVYFGNPLDSVSYLKNVAKRADAEEIQCESCGNVQTDDILKIIEAKKVNEFGEYTKERLLDPNDWYQLYKKNIEIQSKEVVEEELPEQNFRIPSWFKQFYIYSQRNFFSKLADTQFVILSLTLTPLLALILSIFTKYLGGMDQGEPSYVFSLNENMPAYLFMCVIVSLFVGLIISAEEILSDRKIRSRETFLNLNKYAYFNSKITFLFILSAFQMLTFILIGNGILEIKGLNFNYWLILFSTSCFAVLLGLNISAGLKTVKSIYITIPFILVPLILLSGVIVKYDKLHGRAAGVENVPIVGDLMASRWAYEALIVNQFQNNEFEKPFFEVEQIHANALYEINFLIPELTNKINDLQTALINGDKEKTRKLRTLIYNTFNSIEGKPDGLNLAEGQEPNFKLMNDFLIQLKDYLINKSRLMQLKKDFLVDSLTESLGGAENLVSLKQNYHNESIAELVLSSNELKKIIVFNEKLLRRDTPIFQIPESKIGRAHFFASTKYIGQFEMETITFNIIVLWLMTLILYIALVNDWLRKMLALFDKKK